MIFANFSVSDPVSVQDARDIEVATPMERLEALSEKVEAFSQGVEHAVNQTDMSSNEKDTKDTSS